MIRLRISRPRLSVPRKWAPSNHCGALSIVSSACLPGSYGAIHGLKVPATMSVQTISPPTMTFACIHGRRPAHAPSLAWAKAPARALVADSGIDEGIKGVNDEIDGYKSDGVHEDKARHQRIVACRHAGNQQAADPRPGKNRLDDNRAAQQSSQLQSHDRDDRDQRIGDDVAP